MKRNGRGQHDRKRVHRARNSSPALSARLRHRSSNKYDAQEPNVAKSARARIVVRPAPALRDPIGLLGHPARPRRRAKK